MIFHRAIAAAAQLVTGVRGLAETPWGDGATIYFANHTSHLDFVVIWAALPHRARIALSPAAAEDYWGRSPWRRKIACGFFQAVLIPREGITKGNNPLDRLSAALAAGRSILIFPEGTRRSSGDVATFRPGLFHLASRFPHLPIVPVYLENLSRILPKGTLLPVPLIAQAHFRQPIQLLPAEPRAEFLERARTALMAAHSPAIDPPPPAHGP